MERVWVISLDKQYAEQVKASLKRFLQRDVSVYINEGAEYYPLHYVNGEAVPDTSSKPFCPIDVYADVLPEEAVCFQNVAEGGDLSWIMFWQNEFNKSEEVCRAVRDYLYDLNWEADRFEQYAPELIHFPKDIDFEDILNRYDHHTEYEAFGDNPIFKTERWKAAVSEYFDSYFEVKAKWHFGKYCDNMKIEVSPTLPIDYTTLASRFKEECHRVGGEFSSAEPIYAPIRESINQIWAGIIEEYVMQHIGRA